MRGFCIGLILFALSCAMRGQEFKLQEIKEFVNDSLISKPLPVDLNNNISAVVVLSFKEQINGVSFRGNIIKRDSIKSSVYVLYVSQGTKRITLQHEDFYPFVLDFQENGIKIEGGHAYHAMIDNITSENTNSLSDIVKQQKIEVRQLVFKSDTPIQKLLVNGNVWLFEKGISSKSVPCGTYRYHAESTDGRVVDGQVDVSSKSLMKNVKINF